MTIADVRALLQQIPTENKQFGDPISSVLNKAISWNTSLATLKTKYDEIKNSKGTNPQILIDELLKADARGTISGNYLNPKPLNNKSGQEYAAARTDEKDMNLLNMDYTNIIASEFNNQKRLDLKAAGICDFNGDGVVGIDDVCILLKYYTNSMLGTGFESFELKNDYVEVLRINSDERYPARTPVLINSQYYGLEYINNNVDFIRDFDGNLVIYSGKYTQQAIESIENITYTNFQNEFLAKIPEEFENKILPLFTFILSRIESISKPYLTYDELIDALYANGWFFETNGINLLMPQYSRRVEIEDLNKNFWVIANVLDAVTNSLWNSNGIMNIFSDTLNEIGDLWQNIWNIWDGYSQLKSEVSTLVGQVTGGSTVGLEIEAPTFSIKDPVSLKNVKIKINGVHGSRTISLSDINISALIKSNGNVITTADKSNENIYVFFDERYYDYSGGILYGENSEVLENLYSGNYDDILPKLVFLPSQLLIGGELMFVHLGENDPTYNHMGANVLYNIKENAMAINKDPNYKGLGIQQNYQLYEDTWSKYPNLIVFKKTNQLNTSEKISSTDGKIIREIVSTPRNNILVEIFRPQSSELTEQYFQDIVPIDVFFSTFNSSDISTTVLSTGNLLTGDLSVKNSSQSGIRMAYISTPYPLTNSEGKPILEGYGLFNQNNQETHICKTSGVGSGKWFTDFIDSDNVNSPYYFENVASPLPQITPFSYIQKIEATRTVSGDWQLSVGEAELPMMIIFGGEPARYAQKGMKINNIILTSTDERSRCFSSLKVVGIIGGGTLDSTIAQSASEGIKRFNTDVGDAGDGPFLSTSTKHNISAATIDEADTNYYNSQPINKWSNHSFSDKYNFVIETGSLQMGYFYNYCIIGNKDDGSVYQKSRGQLGIGRMFIDGENAPPYFPKLLSDF